MNKNIFFVALLGIALSIALACVITLIIFDSPFAHNTIDYFSFFAAFFLMADGFYKIFRYRNEPYFPNQLIRHVRILIGAVVFVIHVLQYLYGINRLT